MSLNAKPSKSSSIFRVFLYGLATIITMLLLFYFLEDWRGLRDWNDYLETAALRGDLATPADFRQRRIPNEQNFAAIEVFQKHGYRKSLVGKIPASSRNSPSSSVITLTRVVNWNGIGDLRHATWTRFDQPMSSSNWPGLNEEMRIKAQGVVDQLRTNAEYLAVCEATTRPESHFRAGRGFQGPIPNFVLMRSLAQLNEYAALAELTVNHANEACTNLIVLARLCDGLKGHPALVSAMIRTAIAGLSIQPFYEGWARRQWSDQNYRDLEKFFVELELLPDLDHAMKCGEKDGAKMLIETNPASTLIDDGLIFFEDENKSPFRARLMSTGLKAMPKGWWYQNLKLHHETIDVLTHGVYNVRKRRLYPEKAQELSLYVDQVITDHPIFSYLAAVGIPNVSKAIMTMGKIQTAADQAAIVCALERYHLKNRSYPKDLSALAPEFIAKVPNDLVSGKAPIYRLVTPNEFQLYSVGGNGIDEGGPIRAVENDFEKGDVIWPFQNLGGEKSQARN